MDRFRVWPEGTTQSADAEPYSWMSDDFVVVVAENEFEAYHLAKTAGFVTEEKSED